MKHKIARRAEREGEWATQLLEEHLIEVAQRAYDIGKAINLGFICLLAGLLHDIGKATEDFQKRIRGTSNEHVTHSTQGAVWIYLYIKKRGIDGSTVRLLRDSLVYPILAHHGLIDILLLEDKEHFSNIRRRLKSYTSSYPDGMKQTDEYVSHLIRIVEEQFGESINSLFDKALIEATAVIEKIEKLAKHSASTEIQETDKSFYHGAMMRLVLSVLKEADVYDSQFAFEEEPGKLYTQEETHKIWATGLEAIEFKAKTFEDGAVAGSLNEVRCSLSAEAKEHAITSGPGIYRLDLPTGAGKTQTVLRYALNHAQENNLQRIVYLAPFLSVLEQNAQVIREALQQDEHILEHHSNIVDTKDASNETDDDFRENSVRQYLVESWETPYLLTTLVQFSNTLFSGRAASIRRFSKLIRSVVIMDEIQSLPLKAIYPFNLMSNFLTHIMGATLLHCTATPPFFDHDKVKHPVLYGAESVMDKRESSIASIETEARQYFDRVTYKSLLGPSATTKLRIKDLVQHVDDQLIEHNSALVVCNTKRTALDLYTSLAEHNDCELFYLTTDLCAAHRQSIIKQIDEHLKQNRKGDSPGDIVKVICVSTQLIEAGVDLDFDCVYRAAAGADRIVQTAGRCNREGKLARGHCFIFHLVEENLSHLKEIKHTQDALRTSLRYLEDNETIDIDELLRSYFDRYYVENADLMVYWVESQSTSILEMLSNNKRLVESVKTEHPAASNDSNWLTDLRQQFKIAAQSFQLIEDSDTVSAIVLFENESLVEELYEADESKDLPQAKVLLKRLNRHTIELRRRWVEENSHLLMKLFEGTVLILDARAYSKTYGLQIPNQPDLLIT